MIGWIDATAGAAGDMLLGALIDAGVPLEVLSDAVDAIAPEPIRLRTERVVRGGMSATKCHVEFDDSETHRTWATIRALLLAADFPDGVRALAFATFERLAVAESQAHGVAVDDVHFHEVGALDSIADVVGVCAGFSHLGLTSVTVSTIAVGAGRIETSHGSLPVPGPAVTRLLLGAPTTAGPHTRESCTPTGAALLRTLATTFGPQPSMTVTAQGTGAGNDDPATHANVVRLLLGDPVGQGVTPLVECGPLVIEANVDDLDPRIWPDVLAALFAAGASDAWLTPIVMKKGRPAHTLSALVADDRADAVRAAMFAHSPTIGLRESRIGKTVADREMTRVEVDGHSIGVKIARCGGRVVNVQPEYEDIARAAREAGVPVKRMMARAIAAAEPLWD